VCPILLHIHTHTFIYVGYIYIIRTVWDIIMWPVRGKGNECTGCWWGNPRGRDRWVDPGVDGRIVLRWTLRRWD